MASSMSCIDLLHDVLILARMFRCFLYITLTPLNFLCIYGMLLSPKVENDQIILLIMLATLIFSCSLFLLVHTFLITSEKVLLYINATIIILFIRISWIEKINVGKTNFRCCAQKAQFSKKLKVFLCKNEILLFGFEIYSN